MLSEIALIAFTAGVWYNLFCINLQSRALLCGKNPRQVLTRGQLLEKLWDIDERFVDEHTLTTSISRIRSKIESDGGAPYIKTVYGMGYQWTGGEAK